MSKEQTSNDFSFEEWRLSQKEAADLLGISTRSLRREGDKAPRNSDGTYNAKHLCAWYSKRFEPGVPDEIKQQKLRKLRRENDEAESRLVDMEVLRSHLELLLSSLRLFGDQLGKKVSMTGRQAQAELNRTLREVAGKLANVATATNSSDEGPQDQRD